MDLISVFINESLYWTMSMLFELETRPHLLNLSLNYKWIVQEFTWESSKCRPKP